MKSISSLAVIGLLLFSCKLCSFTGNTNRPTPSSGPNTVSYARDLVKPQMGPLSLVKSYNKEETRKTASGFTAKLLDQSTDAAAGEYKSGSIKSVVLMVCAYSSPATSASLVDDMETDMRRSSAWRTVTNVPHQSGRRIEAQDGQGNGLVIWNNGYWVFMTLGDSLSDARTLADGVDY